MKIIPVVIWLLSFKKPELLVPPLCEENGSIGSAIVIYQKKGCRTVSWELTSDWSLIFDLLQLPPKEKWYTSKNLTESLFFTIVSRYCRNK